MLAKKKAISKKKSTSKAITLPWQQQLAKYAKEGKKPVEKPLVGDFISAKNGKFMMGKAVLGSEIDCVIVGWVFENSYHNYPYSQGEAYPPTCFAIGYDEDNLTAHETSPDRQGGKDHMCEGCKLNEWGSDSGRGKACRNRRRLALVVEYETGKAEVKMMSIPPTSLANWKKFIGDLDNLELHTMQAKVNIHFDLDSTATSAPLVFEFVKEITKGKTLQVLAGVMDEATKLLDKPNDVSNYIGNIKPKPKGKKKKSKFSN